MASEYGHILFNLFALVVVIMLSVVILKKFKLAKMSGNQYINIMQVMPIGQKEKILLVEVQGAFLLLGATATHIETLHIFDSTPKTQDLATPEEIVSKKGFWETLMAFRQKDTV